MLEGATRLSIRAISWGGVYHYPQLVGKAFSPQALDGYFNDLTAKAKVPGLADSRGIPLARGIGTTFFYHPIDICQYALGHYDKWLLHRDRADLEHFLRVSDWLVGAQDEVGGWPCFRREASAVNNRIPVGLPREWHSSSGEYSGMLQGQALSVLARAHKVTGEDRYVEAAERGFTLMLQDTEDGGVCSRSESGVSLEEVPSRTRNTVLNGWIFGTFGLWDYWLRTSDSSALRFFEANYSSILLRVPRYSLGWWSFYDEDGHIAKPFYHRLHISQLTALNLIRPHSGIRDLLTRWDSKFSAANIAKARAVYALQKAAGLVREHPLALKSS